MNIAEKHYTAIWYDYDQAKFFYIDQTRLPWEFVVKELATLDDAVRAIKDMEVRGAPLIGVTAAAGYYLGCSEQVSSRTRSGIGTQEKVYNRLLETRPTAVNLKWALDYMRDHGATIDNALYILRLELERSKSLGTYGLSLIQEVYRKKRGVVNILTHCNAGWLATVDYGTATAPIYMAHDFGIPVHVWVDETRPRNQGAKLTAYELSQHGVPCTVIADNTGGHLMQNGMVDMVIVGTDRVAANGDVANKIGTYLKALAAHDNRIPFYVAMPWSSFDPDTPTGKDIPIEMRPEEEVTMLDGTRVVPEGVPAANYSFDVSPARLITSYITENGIYADKKSLSSQHATFQEKHAGPGGLFGTKS